MDTLGSLLSAPSTTIARFLRLAAQGFAAKKAAIPKASACCTCVENSSVKVKNDRFDAHRTIRCVSGLKSRDHQHQVGPESVHFCPQQVCLISV